MTTAELHSPTTEQTPPVLTGDAGYVAFIREVKHRIQASQIKAAVRVNQELLLLYWDLGEQIVEKQREAKWGDGFLEQMSKDLRAEFPEMKGFSRRNLEVMRQWVRYWQQAVAKLDEPQIAQQLVAQIPWGHNQLIINKITDHTEAVFYVRKTIENHWSRAVLAHQIESGLYRRDGKAIDNFEATLPAPQSDLAKISAVDGQLKTEQDAPTIGMLICKSKNDTVVEYALQDVNKPIGVSEYTITRNLPDEFKSSLPSIEEIEAELDRTD